MVLSGITYYSAVLVLGAAILAISAIYVLWHRAPYARSIVGAFILLAAVIWMLFHVFEIWSDDVWFKLFWKKMLYLGICPMATLWLIYTLYYTGLEKWLGVRNIALLSIIPIVTFFLVVSNEFHHLIWRSLEIIYVGGFQVLEGPDGVWLSFFILYSCVLVLLGCLNLAKMFLHKPRLYRSQMRLMLLFVSIIFLGIVCHLIWSAALQNFDFEPLTFAIGSPILAWAVFRLRLEDIRPVAHDIIVQGMSDSVMVLDAQNRILELNSAARDLIGSPDSEIIGSSIEKVLSAWPSQIKTTQIETRFTYELVVNDDVRTYDFRISPMNDTGGRLVGRIVVIRDITDSIRAEKALKKAYDEVKEKQAQLIQSGKLASIGELASGVAHELNQPLMVIRGTAQFIRRGLEKNNLGSEELINQIEPIERNTKRMMNIIDHLRAFSRQSQSDFQPVDVNKTLNNTFLMVEEQLRLHNIEVKKHLAPDLPKIKGDANQLEQVFLNLITNARDAVEDCRVQMKNVRVEKVECRGMIEIITRLNNGYQVSGTGKEKANTLYPVPHTHTNYVEILVKDTGSGIPLECLDKIFDPFFTTKERGKGTGLGLSISYGIIKDHQGEIEVTETGPGGTTVRIRLLHVYIKR